MHPHDKKITKKIKIVSFIHLFFFKIKNNMRRDCIHSFIIYYHLQIHIF